MLTGGTPNIVQAGGTQNILSAGGIENNNSIRLLLPISYLYFEFSVENEWLKLMKLMKYQKPTKNKNAIYVCLSPHRKLSERHNSLVNLLYCIIKAEEGGEINLPTV
ncbi:uncharacterized protein LOC120355734 [Nilaparvata lugens]|uniref:uncharacterized protein LOC120350116 n=1 Tax=Nilaparvata lugens TaxID=108931 RepID=UPI00193E58AC|nr:uncharacterized protein LOC120350116 [Nilaparvata lugens]XP_039289274.1 uncharacterized protein LOC111062617 isoform X4 [Nilaparvata lugens]XP_039289280.1 uncharacterized protein LOC111062617 isoform X4 [Nilaparvata lugens]XP_039297675.1 uncharacterized protein LOC120354484 isoform X1 [Nilaparvata lugens]XP_039297676.1 uncharacterized protein LOC120354484 isoform X2 [Nilaparvata lugens]XP_039297677.1 uncharacterized protein LOC120354484 isoform X2 [Nilaparvata lugens]XP_039297678.1 unchara